MTLTHKTLCDVGRALYGPSWQTALADALKVNVRTVRRWANDEFNIPAGIACELAQLLWDHADRLENLAVKLDPAIDAKN